MKKLFLSGLFAMVMVVIAACGGSATPEPVEITIEMSEYAYNPSTIELKVGQQVTLNLVNSGALEHEIMFGREVVKMNNRPNGFETDFFEAAGVEPVVKEEAAHMEEGDEHADEHEAEHEDEHEAEHEDEHEAEHAHEGFMVSVPAEGHTSTMEFTVTRDMVGEWEIGCFLEDGVHYDSGMIGTLIVSR